MGERDWTPYVTVAVATLAFAGTFVASWMRDRNNPMSQVNSAALATTATMQSLLVPLEAEIADLRKETGDLRTKTATLSVETSVLRAHVAILEAQIRSLGHEPHPPPHPWEGSTP